MDATEWLFELVSLLGACILLIFVCHIFSKESIIFISFHNKTWRYDDVTTTLWQNQITVIVYSIFLKCLNKVPCLENGGFYPPQRLMCFEKNVNKIDTSCNMFSHCCCRTTLPYVPKNVFAQKFLFGLLNHL